MLPQILLPSLPPLLPLAEHRKVLFSILIGLAERFFAAELMEYLEAYHQKEKAHEIANAPTTIKEEISYFGKPD